MLLYISRNVIRICLVCLYTPRALNPVYAIAHTRCDWSYSIMCFGVQNEHCTPYFRKDTTHNGTNAVYNQTHTNVKRVPLFTYGSYHYTFYFLIVVVLHITVIQERCTSLNCIHVGEFTFVHYGYYLYRTLLDT